MKVVRIEIFLDIDQFALELVGGFIKFLEGQTGEEMTALMYLHCWQEWQIRWIRLDIEKQSML